MAGRGLFDSLDVAGAVNSIPLSWASATKPTTRPAWMGSGALVTGDRWYSTAAADANDRWWEWNGTYWLSENTYSSLPWNFQNNGTTQARWDDCGLRQAYDLWLVELHAAIYVAAPNSGADVWTWGIDRVNSANTNDTIDNAGTSASVGAATWGEIVYVPGTQYVQVNAGAGEDVRTLQLGINRGGAAGGIYGSIELRTRLVHR